MTTSSSRRPRRKSTNWFLIAAVAAVFVVPSVASVVSGYFQGRQQDRLREEQAQGLYAARLRVDSRILQHVPLQPLPTKYQDPQAYPATVNAAEVQVIHRLEAVHVADLFLGEGDRVAAPILQRFDPAQVDTVPLGWIEDTRLLAIRQECTPTTGSLMPADAQIFLAGWLDNPEIDTRISTCVAGLGATE